MKNRDLFRLHEGFKQVKDLPGVRFAIAVARNSRVVAEAIEDLEVAKEPSPEFRKVQEAEAAMLNEHVLRDEEGQPVSGPQRGSFQLQDTEAYNEARKAFFEEHEVALSKRQDQLNAFEKAMEDDCQIRLHTVSEADLPGALTPEMAAMVFEMIENGDS